jgi:small subunit ribosomal protein S20
MPIIKSAIKRNKQAATRRSHNLKVKSLVKQDVRQVTDAITAGDTAMVTEAFKAAQSEIDRAVKKGVFHRNTAARKKSRLAALIIKSQTPVEKPTKAPAKKTAAKKPAAKKSSK